MLSMLSGSPDERRERLKPLLGLEKKTRWRFYMMFTRSWSHDLESIYHFSTGKQIRFSEAEAELLEDPGLPLIRKAIGQLDRELNDAAWGDGEPSSDWREDLDATFSYLDGWESEFVDEMGGDQYFIAAIVELDAPESTDDKTPIDWLVAQMSRLYGLDYSPFGPELSSTAGEFDIVGHEVVGQDPPWVPLTEEEIVYIEGRELIDQPIERDHRGTTKDWELFHRDMWDQIHNNANGRFITSAELAAVAHPPPAS